MSDTINIQVLNNNTLLKTHYRPSFKKVMIEKRRLLNKKEKSNYLLLIKKNRFKNNLTRKTLEASISFYRYLRFKNKALTKIQSNNLKTLLVKRSKTKGVTPSLKLKNKNLPILSHNSIMSGYSLGIKKNLGSYSDFNFRVSMHDLFNNDLGYPLFSEINFLKMKHARFQNSVSKIFSF